jgi:DNA-binding response OmpR family regulator
MDKKGTVLLVESEVTTIDANRQALESNHFEVYSEHTIAGARRRLRRIEPDVILLDVTMPDGDGFAFCREIRENTLAHILFLAAKSELQDIITGLKIGGDDYITRPYNVQELLARLEAVMRRRKIGVPIRALSVGDSLRLDVVSSQAYFNGKSMQLTQKEFATLLVLTQFEQGVVSADHIYNKVWGAPLAGDTRALQTTISRLRKKINHAGYDISVIRGQGYSLGKI